MIPQPIGLRRLRVIASPRRSGCRPHAAGRRLGCSAGPVEGDQVGRRRRARRGVGPLRQVVERFDLGRIDLLELEMALRQGLDAGRVVELRPLGAQRRDAVALAADFDAELGDPLGLDRRFELDLVDVDRGGHERGDDDEMNQSHGDQPPRNRSRAMPPASGVSDVCARRRGGADRRAQLGRTRPRIGRDLGVVRRRPGGG